MLKRLLSVGVPCGPCLPSKCLSSTHHIHHSPYRSFSTLPTHARVARYQRHGAADQVIQLENEPLPTHMESQQIMIRMLAAPINPADINMIEGTYALQPPLPAIGGNEGVGEVIAIGKDVKDLRVGDRVIPARAGFGTWRTHTVCHSADVDPLDADISAEDASTISVNPCTAWRLLHDFRTMDPGDVVLQNGANSGVGLAVIQLAKNMGFRTINVVRERPDMTPLLTRLTSLGADIVVTDKEVSSGKLKEKLKAAGLPAPRLALNCVGGDSSLEQARLLGDNGCLVTYGGMSRRPVTIPTGKLIFNDIEIRGFWLTRWTQQHERGERMEMIRRIAALISSRRFRSFHEIHSFDQFGAALSRARLGYRDDKVVLRF